MRRCIHLLQVYIRHEPEVEESIERKSCYELYGGGGYFKITIEQLKSLTLWTSRCLILWLVYLF